MRTKPMTADEMVRTIYNYWIARGYNGVRVWWDKIDDDERCDHTAVPKHLRFSIYSNIVGGYPPREKI